MPKVLKSPKKDTAIGPLIITCSFELIFHVILREPPLKIISAVGSVRLFLYAATNAAQAPDPQAKVFPAPLSHTMTFICFLLIIWQISTFTFSGKS